MHLLKTLMLSSVLAVVTTVAADAQIRSITTGGNSTGGGSVHITIEDFGKPGRHDPIGPLSQPAALFDIIVTVLPGWTCAQTTTAMYAELVASLPELYTVQIAPTNACIIYVSRPPSGSVGWNINIEVNVEGQTIQVEDGAVPQVPSTWSLLKSQGWIRLRS
ncbi:MAG: hypothetical protein SGI90_08185 [Candidatus Eisenbacteria bacterium]|nr:hypothetical protein [Candidatus Eisenbacteria bacterium]